MDVTITLSRAHKVVERLKSLLQEQRGVASQNLSDVAITGIAGEAQVAALKAKAAVGVTAVEKYMQYNDVLGYVRTAIGKANVAAGVSDLLAKQETLSRKSAFLSDLWEREDVNAITPEQLAEYKPVAVAERSMREPSVKVSLMTPGMRLNLEEQLAYAKKEIFVISDKVSDANANKITLSIEDELAGLLGLV